MQAYSLGLGSLIVSAAGTADRQTGGWCDGAHSMHKVAIRSITGDAETEISGVTASNSEKLRR